ncbi:MAG: T9SS type A sorting domain-containing protein [Rhodothermaceae bacterium]|nr:T9SS type A sorting domain-containing protein [Rhodothermaceae bacterium]MYJ44738.1 T9SS type A sorting domain-containing protein [Rhodothermaceae bacterium]
MSPLLRTYILLLSCVLVHCAWSQPQVALEEAFSNLTFRRPVDLQHFGENLFVVEQPGTIWTFENRQDVTDRHQFLNIQSRVSTAGNEEGLLGLAFHPDFETNGYFFVYYSASSPRRSIVSRFNTLAGNPRRGDPDSEVIILEARQPASNHNGGQLAFGPDGYLYIALGDGGGANDQYGHGQNTRSLLGTISRIDVSTIPYSIPSDNPFAGSTTDRPEIFAWGLRNPWRFSFDPDTGVIYAADVGQNTIEEVNIIENGGNYGWPIMEGTRCFRPHTNCNRDGLILPIFEYDHSNGPASVTGGYVYRGPGVPDLTGWYILGDYVDGRFWGLLYDEDRLVESALLLNTFLQPLSFGIDHQGEVYMLASDGDIYRFSATGGSLGFESFIEPLQFTRDRSIPTTTLPAARGGSGIFRYSLSPSPPAGLVFDPSTRTLQGTATEILNPITYTLHAEDTSGLRGSITFELSVHEPVRQAEPSEPLTEFFLHGHYPNPSSGNVSIVFDLPEQSIVTVELYDLIGRRVVAVPPQTMPIAIRKSILLPVSTLPGGSYIYRLTVDGEKDVTIASGVLLLQ